MEPAQKIIDLLGGPNEVARITGAHRTRVTNWKRPKDKGGTGGVIPIRHVSSMLAAAKEKGIELSADDFLPPREEK